MINLSNKEALSKLKDYELQSKFLDQIKLKNYPELTLEQVFYLINTGTMTNGMKLDSTVTLLEDMKTWISQRSHGGLRKGAGRKKEFMQLKNITFSADAKLIAKAKKIAKNKYKSSLQSLFRDWMKEISNP